ncbi:hypothetical protein Hanom_Chr06g00540521 [Helianthus anomalus]
MLYQLSIINRFEKAYNFFCVRGDLSQGYASERKEMDESLFEDKLLHLAAKLVPEDKLNTVTSAALLMQRELHWFKVKCCSLHSKN